MTKIKKFLLNPWIVGIGSAVASGAILKTFDILAGTDIFNKACRVLFKSMEFIRIFLSYRISLSLILITGIVLTCLIIVSKKLFFLKIIKIRPKYLGYTEDIFQGVLYRWNYSYIDGRYKIGDIIAYCPTCKHRIVHDECLSCNSVFLIDKKDRQQREAMIRYGIEVKYQVNEFYELGK